MSRGQFVDPAHHEMDVHLIFDQFELQPYFALDHIRKQHDGWATEGKPTATMQFDGDEWALCYDYQKMEAVAPRDHPDYHLESVPQFRIYFVAKDGLYDGERADRSDRIRGGTVTIRPRWPDMCKPDGTPIRGVPNIGRAYVDVQIQASNIDHLLYHDLARSLSGAWGISERYLNEPHKMSNIGDMALYVRLCRNASDPLYAPDGPIARTHGVLEGGMSGFRSHKEDHRKIPGYYVSAVLDDGRTREVFRGSKLGKELKHYYPLNPHRFDPDEPLYHPKFEVSYQASVTDETLYWRDVEDAQRELEETLYNYLEWAGLPVCADEDVYFSDEYFDATSESERNVRQHNCPLPKIEDEQEATVMRIWGQMNGTDRELISQLVTDGGRPSRKQLAERSGYSYRTIRRFVKRCEEVLNDTFDGLEIASKYEQDLLVQRVRAAESNLRDAVEDAVLTAADAATDRAASKWTRVKRRYGISVRETELKDEIKVRHTPKSREEEVDMIQEIRNAARERYGGLRSTALTMKKWDGSHWRCPSLVSWTKSIAVTPLGSKRQTWIRNYLGCDPADADEQERREALQEWRATH